MAAGQSRRRRFAIKPIIAGILIIAAVLVLIIPKLTHNDDRDARADCIANLKLIAQAKRDWASETNLSSDAVPTWDDPRSRLGLYHGAKDRLNCPDGGIYTIGALTNAPTCTVKGHMLE